MSHVSKISRNFVGAHISIAGGFDKAVSRAESIECTTFQVFLHSNRQWTTKPLDTKAIENFHKAIELSGFQLDKLVVHASYLLNLASPQKETRDKSLELLLFNLKQCQELGFTRFVLHPGSAGEGSRKEAIDHIAQGLNRALDKTENKNTFLALENMAGQGSNCGRTLEELALIRENIEAKERVGFCFDTCHAFAGGYNFNTQESYDVFWNTFDSQLGLKNLLVFHLNDSKKEFNSRIDRHENIGQGKVGIELFRLLMNDQRFVSIPKILETPSEDKNDLTAYKKNIETLRSLIEYPS